jgi:hypothetical protein
MSENTIKELQQSGGQVGEEVMTMFVDIMNQIIAGLAILVIAGVTRWLVGRMRRKKKDRESGRNDG